MNRARKFEAAYRKQEMATNRLIKRFAMKSNAKFYLPWSAVADLMAFHTCPKVLRQTRRHLTTMISVEKLDGGCALYRLIPLSTQMAKPAAAK